ncbi:Npun_F5749 family FMN-dependent PPOX-type flavoprotein [Calothrix sp. PCC 6303]|uniref:Npun_F5749 family FMN-dependent PPOX-type flavoprotein n=1 Tax=Calothrix sp. PCC 6303 TaxID=1170562 RepID=UPI0002A04093|nr:Npun_F5749 family FMN-dependent PPOX-type flavoprotein [Calothrix sp. PCC 6303]AFZ03950.1 pyridoxamine 5'-phosphate oxidase-related, FMN-binding protein [Calothrix sp. PCC 6303]
MSLAPWRSRLARALQYSRTKPESRYFQLATITTDGLPANRTVVFRGFLDDTNQLKIITDIRSQKCEEIRQQAAAEACWYFTGTREQFRIRGELLMVDVNYPDLKLQHVRQQTWQNLSDAARIQFFWANPGEKRADAAAFSPPPTDEINPGVNFCLLLLDPVKVDYLQLRGEPQNRRLYIQDESGNWSDFEINP